MGSYDAYTQIKDRFEGQWALLHPTVPTYMWEDTNAAIGSTLDPFILLEFVGGIARQMTIGAPGSNWWNDTSTFMIHCYYPVGTPSDTARSFLQDASTIFRGVTEGTVIYGAPFPPRNGLRDEADGNWFSLSMSVPYQYRQLA